MLGRSSLSGSLKIFVKEKGCSADEESNVEDINFQRFSSLTGENAKKFYEEIISMPSAKEARPNDFNTQFSSRNDTRVGRLKKNDGAHSFRNSDLLAFAQNNDTKNLTEFFSRTNNFDVNVVDDFGWTPLMCASCSGAEQAVKILLEKGADPTKGDKWGNTPLKIAYRKHFLNIIGLLENYETICLKKRCKKNESVSQSSKPSYCDLCKNETFDERKHETSTLHVFNSKYKSSTFYGIPESNKGFQLLLRGGWQKDRGLGPDGKGRKFPIKAKLKKDKSGVGAPELSANSRAKSDAADYSSEGNPKKGNKSASFIMEDPDKSLRYLQELEGLGHEILEDRLEIVALDKQRNQTREGLREIRKTDEGKVWFALGPLLVKCPRKKVRELMEKDQIHVDAEINKLRSDLKVKVNKLRDMEHEPPVPGLMLKAMSPAEMKAVNQVLGRCSN